MTDNKHQNIIDRIARTTWVAHRDRQLAQLGMKPSEYAADIPIPNWAYAIALAIVAELGIEREDGECSHCSAQLPCGRWVAWDE